MEEAIITEQTKLLGANAIRQVYVTIETTYLVKGNYHIVFTRALPLHVWEVGVFIRVDLIIRIQNIVYSGVDISKVSLRKNGSLSS